MSAPSRGRRPIERYVRCSVEIPHGSIEVGVQYFDGDDIAWMRAAVIDLTKLAGRMATGSALAVDDADRMTRWLDERLAKIWTDGRWGDARGRFIEVWNADEAITQVYAPCGMPRDR